MEKIIDKMKFVINGNVRKLDETVYSDFEGTAFIANTFIVDCMFKSSKITEYSVSEISTGYTEIFDDIKDVIKYLEWKLNRKLDLSDITDKYNC